MKTLKLITIALLFFTTGHLNAQSRGILKGTVTDENGAPMLFANVAVMEDSLIVTAATTDENGDYTIRELVPGTYTVRVTYVTYNTKNIVKVAIDPNKTSYVNARLSQNNLLGTIETSEVYRKPVIDPGFSTVTNITFDQIEHMAVAKGDIIAMIVNVTPGVLETPDGKDLYVRGSRAGSTAYYVDGNRIMGSPEVPALGIAGMEVLTGGVPPEYGDCTGGIVVITTKEYQWEMHKKEEKRKEREEAMRPEKKVREPEY
jgi:hypothetical protein